MTIDLDKLTLVGAENLDKSTNVTDYNLGKYIISLSKYMEEIVVLIDKKK